MAKSLARALWLSDTLSSASLKLSARIPGSDILANILAFAAAAFAQALAAMYSLTTEAGMARAAST